MRNVVVTFLLLLWGMASLNCNMGGSDVPENISPPSSKDIILGWQRMAGKRDAKVIYARPPKLFVMNLSTGVETPVPNVTVAGAKGRRLRGKSPRPSWSPDGNRFVYRFDGHVYVCDEQGHKTEIVNSSMDCSDETRWSWFQDNGTDWLAGPSKEGNVILVKVSNPTVVRMAYGGGDVEKHCELTGSGKFVVYDNGSFIYVSSFGSMEPGIKISTGQSCRPCASPDDRAAWLQVPHVAYHIHDAATGRFLKNLEAPEGEELYRLNWSNLPDFAVHMFGSRGDERIHVRKIGSGDSLYIGWGWDPDLWVEERPLK